MSKIESYKDLIVWQKGIELVKIIYKLTQGLPKEGKFGLIDQMRRCSVSVPSNIAEGWGRGSKANYSNFLKIARGSLLELETQLIICKELNLLKNLDSVFALLEEESKMLNSLLSKLK